LKFQTAQNILLLTEFILQKTMEEEQNRLLNLPTTKQKSLERGIFLGIGFGIFCFIVTFLLNGLLGGLHDNLFTNSSVNESIQFLVLILLFVIFTNISFLLGVLFVYGCQKMRKTTSFVFLHMLFLGFSMGLWAMGLVSFPLYGFIILFALIPASQKWGGNRDAFTGLNFVVIGRFLLFRIQIHQLPRFHH
jgi:hypothetical protein